MNDNITVVATTTFVPVLPVLRGLEDFDASKIFDS
jgi:hypothetical protein